jgi:RNA polymerase sigma-70 factor (sigma-E family)
MSVEVPSGYDEFVRARTPALLRAAYLLTGDQHLAEDLVQSALAHTHRAWRRLRRVDNAEAYARKVMYHLQVAWWRRRRVAERLAASVPERPATELDPGDRIAIRTALSQALLRLSRGQRAVVVLRYFEDQTEAQTAETLGISIGTVKSQTARALASLRRLAPELVELYVEGGGR